MVESAKKHLSDWYQQNRDLYADLTRVAERTTLDLIENAGIDYLSVSSRTKAIESLLEKVSRKGYCEPQIENTDFAGVRVITYVESDVRRISDLITSSFNVHPDKSIDKTDALNIDQVGYRSVHFVCDLGEQRTNLQEFARFKDLIFEIQVRTMLQHAWAEIHYSRDYKFSGVLPRRISRQIYCMAGTLELVDTGFSALAREIDDYSDQVKSQLAAGQFDIEINSISLVTYLSFKVEFLEKNGVRVLSDLQISKPIIEELHDFGIKSLRDLDKLFSEDFMKAVLTHQTYTTYAGCLRDAMLVADIERYFSDCWAGQWHEAESYTFEMLRNKYDAARVEKIFSDRSIKWI